MKGERIHLWYSGKAQEHGANIQVVTAPDGFPLWVSDVEPGSVHDLTAAREHRDHAALHGYGVSMAELGHGRIRAVTHSGVTAEDIATVVITTSTMRRRDDAPAEVLRW